MLNLKRDGHIHTPFCPHGSADVLDAYVEKAIANGFTEISFTEHAPLPPSFVDPTPDQDSGMSFASLETYFTEIAHVKQNYANTIKINCGLEVDFIEGYEEETTTFLNTYGKELDDAILSVHFLQIATDYYCIDFSPEVFEAFAHRVGSIPNAYAHYYRTVKKSITTDLGPFKPKRIGHPTLIHKFQHAHPYHVDDEAMVKDILLAMKQHGLELDLNSAGLQKLQCLEPYPPYAYFSFIQEIELPYVFGSDAHTVKGLHQYYEAIQKGLHYHV